MKKIALVLGAPLDRSGALSQSDRAATSIALQVLEGQVHVYSHREEGLCYALAAGASEGHFLQSQNEIEFDIALVGSTGDFTAAQLAERKRCPLLLDIVQIQSPDEEGRMEIVRDLGQGAKEILTVSGSVVLRVSEEAENGMYVSRFRRETAAGFLGGRGGDLPESSSAEPRWELAKPRVRIGDLAAKTGGSATSRADAIYGTTEESMGEADSVITGDAATAAKHLLRYLRHHGFITRGGEDARDPVAATPERPPTVERSRRGPRSAGSRRGPRPVPTGERMPEPESSSQAAEGPRSRGPRDVGSARTPQRRKPRPIKGVDNEPH